MKKWKSKGLEIGFIAAVFLTAAMTPHISTAQSPSSQTSWSKTCYTDPSSDKELCLVIQQLSSATGQFVASAMLRQFTGETETSLVVAVPHGLLLQPGMRLQIDDGEEYKIFLGICLPDACHGDIKVEPDFVDAMKHGGRLTISALDPGQKLVTFPMSLIGFTEVYDSEGLAPATAQVGQNELNQALQARAAEVRQKLIDEQQSSAN